MGFMGLGREWRGGREGKGGEEERRWRVRRRRHDILAGRWADQLPERRRGQIGLPLVLMTVTIR